MAKQGAQEITNQVVPGEAHPCAFHVCGPHNLATFNWRDLISSSWKDANYKRTVVACFIQAVYLLELDRQENRTQESALAPNWWIPFKYKLTQTLIDERDGSIFGAIFEWDQSAALADLVPIRPRGAPRAVLALRGTLLQSPTRRRDIEDDLRFAAWENLKGSVRFKVALEVLKSLCDTYGSSNVCIAGHSLGAGFGLQVGKELVKEGIYVDAHLFNPPSVSLPMSLVNVGEQAEYVWNRLKSLVPSGSKAQVSNDGDKTSSVRLKSWIPRLSGLMDAGFGAGKWVPHLYINNNDYICCFYIDTNGTGEKITDKENMGPTNRQIAPKLFVVSKGTQTFREAHGLEQWWSSDAELQPAIHNNSKLISRQLGSLYTDTPSQVTRLFNPPSVSLATNLINIGETAEFVWNILKYVLPSYSEAHVSNDGDETSGVGLKIWIPRLSGLKDAAYWVGKWVPYMYVSKSNYICCSYTDPNGTGEKIADKENVGPTNVQIAANLFVVSKAQLKFLAAHGLEQRWPSDAELQQAINNSKLISRQHRSLYTSTPWQVTHLFNPSSVSLFISLSNIGEKAEFAWKWNILKSMLPSSSEAQVSNDGDKTSGVQLKCWIPRLSGLRDAGFVVGKWVPLVYGNSSNYIGRQLRPLYSGTPWQGTHLFNLPSISLAMGLRNTGEKAEFVWNRLKSILPSSNEAQVSNEADMSAGVRFKRWIPQLSGLKDAGYWVGKWVPYLYVNKSDGTVDKMVDEENMGPTNGQIAAQLFVVSKEKQKFLEARGLEQCGSSDAELQQAIHNSKLMSKQLRSLYTCTPWQVTHLFNPPSVSLAMSLRKAHGLQQWWSSDAELQRAIHYSKLVSQQLRSLYSSTPSQVTHGKPR